jgi:hypothetical protein
LNKVGIHRKHIKHVKKHVGKIAAHMGIDALSTAANAYGVRVPEELREIAKHSADHLIDGNRRHVYEAIMSSCCYSNKIQKNLFDVEQKVEVIFLIVLKLVLSLFLLLFSYWCSKRLHHSQKNIQADF